MYSLCRQSLEPPSFGPARPFPVTGHWVFQTPPAHCASLFPKRRGESADEERDERSDACCFRASPLSFSARASVSCQMAVKDALHSILERGIPWLKRYSNIDEAFNILRTQEEDYLGEAEAEGVGGIGNMNSPLRNVLLKTFREYLQVRWHGSD